MDLKFKGRTWVGNIYHKFETMCQEVDDFVHKDTVKFVENHVNNVGESVKKIYSNVLNDFQPPRNDSVKTKTQTVTQNQDDATGTSIRAMASIKEKPIHTSEMQLSNELDTVDFKNCKSTALDSPYQFNPSPCTDFPKDEESSSHWKEGSDAAILKTTMAVKKDIGVEDYKEASILSNPKDVNSTKLLLHRMEQHPLTKNVESSEGANLSLPSDFSNDQDHSSDILADSPRNVVEDMGLRTLQKDETRDSTDLSEEAESGFSLEQGGDTSICRNSEIGVEENAMMVELPACENVDCLEDKNLCKHLCIKEQIPVENDLCSSEDKIVSLSSSIDEDNKGAFLLKNLPEKLIPHERLNGVSFMEIMDNYAGRYEEVETNLSLEQGGLGLEVNVSKEHPLNDSRSAPDYRYSSEGSLFLWEQHPLTEGSTSVKDESLPNQLLISTNEDKVIAVDKFLPETSFSGDWLRVLEYDGVFDTTHFSEEAKTDFSVDRYHSCTLSDSSLEENGLVQKHTLMKHLDCSEDVCDLSVCSRNPLLRIEGFDSPKDLSASKSPLVSGTEDHTITITAKFLPITTHHNEGPLHKDEATYTCFLDVLSTNNVPSDLVSSNISSSHNEAQPEASSCLTTELSHSNHTQKTENEKNCCDYTHTSGSASHSITLSSSSLSCLGSNYKTENQIPAFSRTALSSVGCFQENLDDLTADVADANLETIDLSDKANPEKSCSTVDDELLFTPSFGRRNFRSYKKLIKEAFASRKKLVKEYKQLPIWYEDIDTLTSLHSEKNLLPQTGSASTSSPTCNIGETEWELV